MRNPFALWRSPVAAFAIASGLLALSAPAAHAQFFNFMFGGGMRPDDVENMLVEERGLELIGPVRRNGDVYIADVRGRRGAALRLIIDARDGRIVQSFRLGSSHRDADLIFPRPPADVGTGADQDQPGATFSGAPPAVVTFGEPLARRDDLDGPNFISVPHTPGEEGAPKPRPKH